MKEFKVTIPEEKYEGIDFVQDGLPGVAVVNVNLKGFEPKEVFGWHCSVMIHLQDMVTSGTPSEAEEEALDEFIDWLDRNVKGLNKKKPNALFLSKITWNQTIEMIWRVFEPEIVDELLRKILSTKQYVRKFDYRIDPDNEWKLAHWHLSDHKES